MLNLLDPGAPFLEVGLFAAHGLYDGAAPSAGVIAGIGRVASHEVLKKRRQLVVTKISWFVGHYWGAAPSDTAAAPKISAKKPKYRARKPHVPNTLRAMLARLR